MGRLSRRRLGIVLWSVFVTEAVGLAAGFALADPTRLRPDYSGVFLALGVLLMAELQAAVAFVIALVRRTPEAAWWAAASAVAIPAVVVMLLESGTGFWFTWCVVAVFASFVATLLSFRRASRPGPGGGGGGAPACRAGMGAAALSVVALVAAVSMSTEAGMDDVDFSGTWTAPEHDLTLTLTGAPYGQGGRYTLRWGACSEEAAWSLDSPQMTTSVQVWLDRDEVTHCLPASDVEIRVAGGTVADPVLGLTGPDRTDWLLTRP
ncbi:hypothetical protein J7F03_30740 [Streptomyces sp. ISL-43]|uniref:hypothetical protein n=1 Tax=Streptomyces sp. ISL-43 TaxID=2819183 RepID=UPI001BE86263|nr:hypothetical protein [Streptomyces sp. ISL-43]MBT2451370.1 hypothetical protein [Streptomyces sp. ISL-43]